ncbi:MAG: VTT domain-containing protein [Candidatus Woesebacteria bacterium]|jgi:membrane protein DedA with SNARE-associated domain
MHQIMDQITNFLENLAQQIPLTVFAFIGSLVDEIIAFIPSPLVPIIAGTMAYSQGYPFMYLFLFAFTGTLGKTLASYLTYWISDKLEDVITTSKLGKILGLEKHELEKYGRYFDGTYKDEVIMIILRSLPFVPTLPVSVMAGLIKIKSTSFIFTTFVGTYIRFMFFLIVAYEGVKKYEGLLDTLDTTNTILEITLVLTVLGWGFLFLRKHSHKLFKYFFGSKNKEQAKKKTKK